MMKAICVDDEKIGMEYLITLCDKIEILSDVKGFAKSREALDYCEKNQVDIAMLDINMPDINGITLTSKLREINPDIRIIFVTAYEQYAVDAFSVHADGYLLKPVTLEVLKNEVEYVLSGVKKALMVNG